MALKVVLPWQLQQLPGERWAVHLVGRWGDYPGHQPGSRETASKLQTRQQACKG